MTGITTNEIDRLARLYSKSKLSESGKLRLVQAIVRANERSVASTTPRTMPDSRPASSPEGDWAENALQEFLPLSAATNRLAKGMWGGWQAPAAVRDAAAANLKPSAEEPFIERPREGNLAAEDPSAQNLDDTVRSLRPGFVPRRACAAKLLWEAVLKGEIVVYLVPDRDDEMGAPDLLGMWPEIPVRIPVEVLKKLIMPLTTLSDHAIRPTLRAIGDPKLHALLMDGRLMMRGSEFDGWYDAERRKGKWPSQAGQRKERRGRPTLQSERLKAMILAIVQDARWDGTRKFTELATILEESEQVSVPSMDTLRRLVRRLAVEHGDVRLNSRVRKKRPRFDKTLTAK